MSQPNDLSRSLVTLDQDSTIIAVVEMSQSSWLEGQPGGYTFYVRTLSSQLGKAYFDSMRYVGPDRIQAQSP